MPKSVLTAEFPSVKVGPKTYVLKPTLKAVRLICTSLGGLRAALMKCNDINVDATVAVIAAGADLTFDEQADLDAFTEKLLFHTPRDAYEPGIAKYLLLLLQGGQDAAEKKSSEDAAASEGNG